MSHTCADDKSCKEFVSHLETMINDIWSTMDGNITAIDLSDTTKVDNVVNKLLASK